MRNCGASLIMQSIESNPDLLRLRDEATISSQQYVSIQNTQNFSVPVVFNIVGTSTVHNYVTDTRLANQIDRLNQDYSASNSDIGNIPSTFLSRHAGNTNISFYLHSIQRRTTSISTYSAAITSTLNPSQEQMKRFSLGGIDSTDTSSFLNVWICNFSTNGINPPDLLGYAYFPYLRNYSNSYRLSDGVVMQYTTIPGIPLYDPYNLGRTLTHEVGHYLGLYHLWLNSNGTECSATTCCSPLPDIPGQIGPNYGKPSHPHRLGQCGTTGDMFMNFMDYVDDDTMIMFSNDQKTTMHNNIIQYRSSFLAAPTPTPTSTNTPTPTITPTNTPTNTTTPTQTPTPTITPSVTPTNTITPSITPTITNTASLTPSITPTISLTPSITPTITVTPTITTTPNLSLSPTPTVTITPSLTPSRTPGPPPDGPSLSLQYNNNGFLGSVDLYSSLNNSRLLFGSATTDYSSHILSVSGNNNNIFNSNRSALDFIIKGKGNKNLSFSSNGNLSLNTAIDSTGLASVHIISSSCQEGIRLEDTNSCYPANMTLFHKPRGSISSDSVVGSIDIEANNSSGNPIEYVKILAKSLNSTRGSTKGEVIIQLENGQNKIEPVRLTTTGSFVYNSLYINSLRYSNYAAASSGHVLATDSSGNVYLSSINNWPININLIQDNNLMPSGYIATVDSIGNISLTNPQNSSIIDLLDSKIISFTGICS